jgi:hypothetical protein
MANDMQEPFDSSINGRWIPFAAGQLLLSVAD